MTIKIHIQTAIQGYKLPARTTIKQWIAQTIALERTQAEVCLRIVDQAEMTLLNQTYRHKQGPTNVLAFPAALPITVEPDYLGDIILCAPVVQQEAHEQAKPLFDHFAHMLVHGTLHLLGYDHINENDAQIMERREIEILATFEIPNPYRGDE